MPVRGKFALLGPLLLAFLVTLLFLPRAAASPIRSVEATTDRVLPIHTSVGFSTVLEFESKPISAVLGDQDLFKLEYVGNSVTIKPLASHAKTNLFVFTEYERYNYRLVTVPAGEVDYIVRIKSQSNRPSNPEVGLIKRKIGRTATYRGFKVEVVSMSRERNSSSPLSVTLIDFSLSSRKDAYAFQPASLGIKQSGRFLNIENLYLDTLELIPGDRPTQGRIALLRQDLNPALPVSLVFAVPSSKSQRAHRIEVPATKVQPPKPDLFPGKTDEKGK